MPKSEQGKENDFHVTTTINLFRKEKNVKQKKTCTLVQYLPHTPILKSESVEALGFVREN